MRALELVVSVFLENFFVVGAGLSIIGVRHKLSRIAFIGAIFGLTVYGVRVFYETQQIPLGTHSFIIIVAFIIILKFIDKQKWSVAIIATLVSFLLLILGEGIFMFNIIKLFNLSIEDIIFKPNLRIVGTLLSDIPLIIVFIMGYILKFSIIDINRVSKKEEI